MPFKATHSDVQAFLKEWQAACLNGLDFVPREKNMEFLRSMGWTQNIAKDILKNLSVAHYVSGPESDHNQPGQVWVFGIQEAQQVIYAKIKLYQVNSVTYAKCLSFHKAAYAMRFPYMRG